MDSKPTISFVVAMAPNRLIGGKGTIPWRLPDDMKHFKQVTMGKPVLMGRKTYESIPPRFRPLIGRTNIILTHQQGYSAPGCIVVHSLPEAFAAVDSQPELMVIGGAQLYEQLLPDAWRIYLTIVDGEFEGDVFFPPLDMDQWREVSRINHNIDESHRFPFTILTLERFSQSLLD